MAQLRCVPLPGDAVGERVLHDERPGTAVVQHVIDFVGLQPVPERHGDELAPQAGGHAGDGLPAVAGPDADPVAAAQAEAAHGPRHALGMLQQVTVREPRPAVDDSLAVRIALGGTGEHRPDVARALRETGQRASEMPLGGQPVGISGTPADRAHGVLPATTRPGGACVRNCLRTHFLGVGRAGIAAQPARQDALRDGREPEHREGHVEVGIDRLPAGAPTVVGDVARLVGNAVCRVAGP